jgi:hypothetical protein
MLSGKDNNKNTRCFGEERVVVGVSGALIPYAFTYF